MGSYRKLDLCLLFCCIITGRVCKARSMDVITEISDKTMDLVTALGKLMF